MTKHDKTNDPDPSAPVVQPKPEAAPAPQSAPRPNAGAKRPMAQPARMRRRHWGLAVSFGLAVLLPAVLGGFYLFAIAEDQYVSTTGFTVRQDEGSSATEILGGLAQFTGASSSPDGDVLYEFIRSQEIVRRVNQDVDLRAHYSQNWPNDPAFSLPGDATIEDLHHFWDRMVRVSYDQSTGLTELQVFAFDPDSAQAIAKAVVAESQQMVNALNEAARTDAIRYAAADLDEAKTRLKETREALTRFRTRTQIVDIEADIQGRMGVMNNLQQQLAQELVSFDELTETAPADDPRVTQALRRIEVIRNRIAQERDNFANTKITGTDEDYPTLISEYEGLQVEREFAEQNYRAALTAYEAARSEEARQSRYLATYITPTLAEKSEYPQRFLILGVGTLFLMFLWGIGALIYYSIRDRR
ncbi:sugar transporter [Pseudooceanicola sp. LIPI14-2-Ac024]|uniref:sugar transporter n=1 Tax=Pseudooceanicola sp. LIPI14-2-Ac024 TaxID=3344875 RepID=UPI0035D07B0E